ncbi:hypothetical protein BHE74_00040573 [Ensete ventricosum]|nr:hypothetical protein BHE74_00040573 [Ensete ventricosum]RZR97836.1 hypothetical protein BHM03_00027088 [Ensete ventricosum]
MRSVPGRHRNSLGYTCTYMIARVTSPPAASISPTILFSSNETFLAVFIHQFCNFCRSYTAHAITSCLYK